MAVENDSSNDLVTSSCLPSGLLEYISTWNNENIANGILLENYVMNKNSQNSQVKETNAAKKETLIEERRDDKITNYKNETIASREQASFKIFGFEFAPVFIPIERRLQVFNGITYLAKFLATIYFNFYDRIGR